MSYHFGRVRNAIRIGQTRTLHEHRKVDDFRSCQTREVWC